MKVTIEDTTAEGKLLKCTVEEEGITDFDEVVNLFRLACMGFGFVENTVDTLEPSGELLKRIKDLEEVNETLRGESPGEFPLGN